MRIGKIRLTIGIALIIVLCGAAYVFLLPSDRDSAGMQQAEQDIDKNIVTKISFQSVRLLMGEKEFVDQYGKGNPLGGCKGCVMYAYFPQEDFSIGISDDLGSYKNVVVLMETKNDRYDVLGVRIGSDAREAEKIMANHHFATLDEDDGRYRNRDLIVTLVDDNHDGRIDGFRVELYDKLPPGVMR